MGDNISVSTIGSLIPEEGKRLLSAKVSIKLTYVKPDALVKEINAVKKTSINRLLKWWHTQVLPEHFKYTAEQKYEYKKRTGYTLMRKRKSTGHTKPLLTSGNLKQELKTNYTITTRGNTGVLKMTGPKYATIVRKRKAGAEFIYKPVELTILSDDELRTMSEKHSRYLIQELQKARASNKLAKETVGN